MDTAQFSQRYIQILEDVVSQSTGSIQKEPWILSELEEKFRDLFASPITGINEVGQGYHFGYIENGVALVGSSSICLNRILLQDVIFRYTLVTNQFSEAAKSKYLIVRVQEREKMLKKLRYFIDEVLKFKPFIQDEIVQIIPHPCMCMSKDLVELAERMTEEYERLSSSFMHIDKRFDRSVNYAILGSEKWKGMPFTDWSYGLQHLEDKLRILSLLNELKTASPNAVTFKKRYSAYNKHFDETYKCSLMPQVLSKFDFVQSYFQKKIAKRDYESLLKTREAYAEFRDDFFSLVEEVSKTQGNKRDIEEIISSVEDEINHEIKLARRSVKTWKLIKIITSITSTAMTYINLDPIGSLLSIPGLPSQVQEMKKTWSQLNHKPNKVVMLIQRIKTEEKKTMSKARKTKKH